MIDAMLAFAQKQLDNDFVIAVAFTAILASLRNLPWQLWRWIKRRVITTVDIADHDPAYFWVQAWLSQHAYTRYHARLLTASTRMRVYSNNEGPGSGRVDVTFSPAPGIHLLKFKGKWLVLDKVRREVDNEGSTAYRETFTFYTFSRELIRELILEAQEVAFPPNNTTVSIYRAQSWAWNLAQKRTQRSLDSVVLDGGIAESIRADIIDFSESKQFYADQGIPYQRGYLLSGPPGSGKGSLVVALASDLKRDIYIINLNATNDDQLLHVMGEVPENSFVLIEDIDCSFNLRKSTKDAQHLSFSGLLNALDGLTAPPGRVLFMTSNHPDKLDSALKRRGRTDKTFHLDYATKDQARRMYLRFFSGQVLGANEFAKHVVDAGEVSMADIQEHLLMNRNNESAAAVFQLTQPAA